MKNELNRYIISYFYGFKIDFFKFKSATLKRLFIQKTTNHFNP